MQKLLLLYGTLLTAPLSAQLLQPSTLNATGGNYVQRGSTTIKNFSFMWSVGESTLIETFTTPNGSLIITQGVLQPVTAFDLQTAAIRGWTKEELKVYPVPVADFLQVDLFINDTGKVLIQVFDLQGRVLATREFLYNTLPVNNKINFIPYANGTYLLKLSLFNNGALKKTSVFKIIKLRN